MISFFLDNESFINIVSMIVLLISLFITSGMEDDKTHSKVYTSFIYMAFITSFSTVTLSVIVNGAVKGFN